MVVNFSFCLWPLGYPFSNSASALPLHSSHHPLKIRSMTLSSGGAQDPILALTGYSNQIDHIAEER